MLFLRSLCFNLCFALNTLMFSIIICMLRFIAPANLYVWAQRWTRSTLFMLRLICGIRVEIEGKENLPDEACVVMAKHQSALETIAMPMLIPSYVWILKYELFYIPFFGWALWALDAIAIRRGNPRKALKQVNTEGMHFLKQGRWVVIFPEGTRSNVGETGEYKAGGIILAQKAHVGILPLAHNAGECWSKRAFIKKPGKVTLRFLPFIAAETVQSAQRNELLNTLQDKIEENTRQLERISHD